MFELEMAERFRVYFGLGYGKGGRVKVKVNMKIKDEYVISGFFKN